MFQRVKQELYGTLDDPVCSLTQRGEFIGNIQRLDAREVTTDDGLPYAQYRDETGFLYFMETISGQRY
jgi:hypothetical protein